MIVARGELSAVRVRVAIAALGERNRFFEICVGVAFHAVHIGVLAEQWEFRLGMVELPVFGHVFPTTRRVAGVASLSERPMVRVSVAVGTFREGNARESRGSARYCRRVAFGARHLGVQSG